MKISPHALLFSMKLFLAGILAFGVAVRIGLPQPAWALVTCCVCMNPMSGAIRSKVVYRITGTVSAGIVTLALVAIFGSIPLLLIVASGLVASLAFGFSYLDRTPRSYGFQLFAITLMLVGVAGVDHPETMFNTVVARTSEIGLGILATTFVDSIIAPRSMAGTLRDSLQRWLPSMARWSDDIFSGHADDAKAHHDRLKLLSDISSLSQMTALLRYDPTVDRRDLRYAVSIQQRLLRMVPLLSAIADRVAAFGDEERAALGPVLAEIRRSLAAGEELAPDLGARMRLRAGKGGASRPWQMLAQEAFADMVSELAAIWRDIGRIDAALEGRGALDAGLDREIRAETVSRPPPDFDHAARMAAGIAVAFGSLCLIWYATGWHQGANMALLGTVALAFFGGGDEPGQAIARFALFSVFALGLAAVLCYAMLPFATDFPTFALMLGIVMLPLGVWAASNPMAVLLLAIAFSNINLQASYTPFEFGTFLEAGAASLFGIYVAFLSASLFRDWGSLHQIERFLRIEKREIGQLARSATERLRDQYVQRALDRVATMTTRLAETGQVERSATMLARVRIGIGAADLRLASAKLDPGARASADRVLLQVGAEFEDRDPSSALLATIDTALDTVWKADREVAGEAAQGALYALAGLRIALFARAPAWVPSP